MNPGEVRPRPGKDSMGMDMVPVYEGEDTSAQDNIQVDAVTIQRMNLRTALVEHGPVRREFRTVGIGRLRRAGPARHHDEIRRLDGEALRRTPPGPPVKAGDPLFEVYSPDLYNAQLNYLVAVAAARARTAGR